MTAKLSTTVNHIQMLTNAKNRQLILQFHDFMMRNGNSQAYQNNNLKVVIAYSQYLPQTVCLDTIRSKSQIISFLDTKIKGTAEDPDKRWITTWNDYLGIIKFFFRWLHNHYEKAIDEAQFSDWETPDFVKIRKRRPRESVLILRPNCGTEKIY